MTFYIDPLYQRYVIDEHLDEMRRSAFEHRRANLVRNRFRGRRSGTDRDAPSVA